MASLFFSRLFDFFFKTLGIKACLTEVRVKMVSEDPELTLSIYTKAKGRLLWLEENFKLVLSSQGQVHFRCQLKHQKAREVWSARGSREENG